MTFLPKRCPWGLGFGLVTTFTVVAIFGAGLVSGQPDWPTPPPASAPPVPRIFTGVKPAPVSFVPGAASWTIQPRTAGLAPQIPPLPFDSFESRDGVRLVIEAGTLSQTLQLVYEPLQLEEVGSIIGSNLTLVRAFEINGYDYQAKRVTPSLLRPWVLEIDVPGGSGASVNPTRLLIARENDSGNWVPMVTIYHRDSRILEARILGPGRYAVLKDSLVSIS